MKKGLIILLMFCVIKSSNTQAQTLLFITLTPGYAYLDQHALGNDKHQLKAIGHYSDNTQTDITNAVTWSSSSPAIIAVSNTSGSKGLCTSFYGQPWGLEVEIKATLSLIYGSTTIWSFGSFSYNSSDDDYDGDGLFWTDKCPFTYDPTNADADTDGKGDVCDCNPTTPDPAIPSKSAITIHLVNNTNNLWVGGSQKIYAGNAVHFTTQIYNAGPNPQYKWKKNGVDIGITTPELISSNFINGDIVTCELTSGASCDPVVLSNARMLNILPQDNSSLSSNSGGINPISNYGNNFLTDASGKGVCRIRASLASAAALHTAVNYYVDVNTTDLTYTGQPFVKRHYEINPYPDNTSTPTPASLFTAEIALYFTDAEFVQYNTTVGTAYKKLPTLAGGGNADPNVTNLRIKQFHGAGVCSSYDPDICYQPSGYTGSIANITPSVGDVGYDVALNRWVAVFPVTGFSGFFVYTNPTSVLPLNFTNFTVTKCNTSACLSWKTENEVNVKNIEVERSTDGILFNKIHTVQAKNLSTNLYTYQDDIATVDCKKGIFYRLKQIDNDAKFTYSNILSITCKSAGGISVSPNPVKDIFNVHTTNKLTRLMLVNTNGQTIKEWRPNAVNKYSLTSIASGVYYVKIYTDSNTEVKKIVVL